MHKQTANENSRPEANDLTDWEFDLLMDIQRHTKRARILADVLAGKEFVPDWAINTGITLHDQQLNHMAEAITLTVRLFESFMDTPTQENDHTDQNRFDMSDLYTFFSMVNENNHN